MYNCKKIVRRTKALPCRLPHSIVAVELGVLCINGVFVKQSPSQVSPLVHQSFLCS